MEQLLSLALSKCRERKEASGITANLPLSDTNGKAEDLRYVRQWQEKVKISSVFVIQPNLFSQS